MIITRKIEVYCNRSDKDLKRNDQKQLWQWRDLVRKGANIVVAHKFTQDNIREFAYLKDEIKEKFYVKDILKDEPGNSEQNTTYRILSSIMKGTVPADIYSCLNQSVSNTFKETKKELWQGKKSLQSFKNNIPIPFSAKALNFILGDDDRYYFDFFKIPMAVKLGADRSNNRVIIERILSNNSEYKLCGSSLIIDDNRKKMYLLLCVDIPVDKSVILNEKNKIFAYLSDEYPIVAKIGNHEFRIGTKEEFLYRRTQIQKSLRNSQINAKYTVGGKGRARKLQSLNRYEQAEKNYVDAKIHLYSRRLIDLALKHECATIEIVDFKQKSEEIKNNDFLLRNWTFHGLRDKIEYKCKKYGINLI